MIDIAQGNVAKLIDAAAVLLLWRVAQGKATDGERHVAAAFPPLLYVPGHVHLPVGATPCTRSVVGTWTRDDLMDYLASGPGGIRPHASTQAGSWLGAVGTGAAFPSPLPSLTWMTREPGRAFAFVPAEREIHEPDGEYLTRTASWYRREALRGGVGEREREGALSAARIAELWLDSARGNALERIDAFELETRLRRMGMAAGDAFAQRFGWSHMLIGVDAVRAFNRLLAPWAAATLMPEPFRLGLVDRCCAHAGHCAVLLAASAMAQNLARAAAEHAVAPRSLPVRGVKYVRSEGGEPEVSAAVHKIIKSAHGMPVFSPMPGHPDGLWEMFVAVRVERTMRPLVFRQPSPLVLRREMDSLDAIIVRLGSTRGGSDEPEPGRLDVFLLSDGLTVGDLDRSSASSGGALSRAVRALWRIDR